MQRVLDIDLDFFVQKVVYWPDPTVRTDPTEHPVWPTDDALAFLTERCGLRRALPGFVTENHGELFPRWRSAIADQLLVPPFHVTHVDAHADLGLGDAGYRYLLTDLLFQEVKDRQDPLVGPTTGLNDGNHLAFAIARDGWRHDRHACLRAGADDHGGSGAGQSIEASAFPWQHHAALRTAQPGVRPGRPRGRPTPGRFHGHR